MTKYINKQAREQSIGLTGVTILEQYYDVEIEDLKELYNKKVYQMEKADNEGNYGLIIILENEIEAIKKGLLAGENLKAGYLEFLSKCANENKKLSAKNEDLKSALDTALIDINLKTPKN